MSNDRRLSQRENWESLTKAQLDAIDFDSQAMLKRVACLQVETSLLSREAVAQHTASIRLQASSAFDAIFSGANALL